jgi:hypothetical protein
MLKPHCDRLNSAQFVREYAQIKRHKRKAQFMARKLRKAH